MVRPPSPRRAAAFGDTCRLWGRPVAAEPLALFRILIGSTILPSLLTSLGLRLALDLGPDGLYPARAADEERPGGRVLLLGPAEGPLLEDVLPVEWGVPRLA